MKVRNSANQTARTLQTHKRPGVLLASAVLILIVTGSGFAGAAHFINDLTYPESGQLLDPGSVTCDSHTGEIFVTDTRGQRVVIFDRQGRYAFDFGDPDHLPGLRQVAADSLGRIYVLRGAPDVTLSVFDYNGDYLHDLRLTKPGTDSLLTVNSILMDEQDRLFVLTVLPPHIYVYNTAGETLNDFAIFTDPADSVLANQPGYGTMALVNHMLVIPVPFVAGVARYTTDGKYVDTFGLVGGGPGELSFPVAATGDKDGHIMVLDKHRHTVLQYGADGRFMCEAGGKGQTPGWFFHPTSLACNQQGNLIVAQTYMGRIQTVSMTDPQANEAALNTAKPADVSK
jgi:DNA-binding beta-propeller fold protein YncE